jgi:hypothetical protein
LVRATAESIARRYRVTPKRPLRAKPLRMERPKKVARTPISPPGSQPRSRSG